MSEQTENKKVDIATFHAAVQKEAIDLEKKPMAEFNVDEYYRVELTPVIGAHIGPGVVGLAYGLDNPLYNLLNPKSFSVDDRINNFSQFDGN